MVIVGGGIGGLVLALCLDQVYNHPVSAATEHQKDGSSSTTTTTSATSTTPTTTRRRPRLPIHVYESTSAYTNNAGGAIGLYSNGLRVLKHLSKTHPALSNILTNVRNAGCDYVYRRWMRHDGLEVAVAREDELLPYDSSDEFVMCDDDINDEEEESSEAQPRRITEVNEESSSSDDSDDEETSTAKDGKEELQEYEVQQRQMMVAVAMSIVAVVVVQGEIQFHPLIHNNVGQGGIRLHHRIRKENAPIVVRRVGRLGVYNTLFKIYPNAVYLAIVTLVILRPHVVSLAIVQRTM